jgi:glucokinase
LIPQDIQHKSNVMIIGVDLGGTNIRAGLESGGKLLELRKSRFNTQLSKTETLSQLIAFIRPLVGPQVAGIGIGVPSVVDGDQGIVFNVANIPSWDCVHLKKILEDEFGLPAVVNNDVNCFALGEHQFGLARGLKNIVGISSGTGLGSGIIINNQLFNGSNCGAGEIGLLYYLDHNIEYYASGNLFRVRFNTTAELAHQRAVDGDPVALAQWREFGQHMAAALKCAVFAYDPEAIVLGGSLTKAYGFFSEAMNESLQDFPYPESIRRLKILPTQNPDITVLGAAALVYLGVPSLNN